MTPNKISQCLLVLAIALLLVACNTSKNISNLPKSNIELASVGPKIAETNTPIATNALLASTENKEIFVEKEIVVKTKIQHFQNLIVQSKNTRKLNFVEKIILRKILKKAENQQKIAATGAGWEDWDGNLKIGVILIAGAVLLSILRVSGAVTGIAALVGLVFIVLGLMNTY